MYLYGAGGHAKVIMDILKENSTELTGIIDDNPHIQEWMEYHVLSYDPKRMFPILISIGNNSIRKNIAEQLYKKKRCIRYGHLYPCHCFPLYKNRRRQCCHARKYIAKLLPNR